MPPLIDKQSREEEYPLAKSYMDVSRPPDALPPNGFSRMVGIDGRYIDTAVKYPGNKYVATPTDVGVPNFFKHIVFTLTDGTEARGFIYCAKAANSALRLYYQVSDGSDFNVELHTDCDYTTYMDVAVNGKFIYVFVESDADYPRVFYNTNADTGAFTGVHLGPETDDGESAYTGQLLAPYERAAGHATSGGYLNFRGRYRVGVKYYDPTRGVHTGMSALFMADMAADVGETSGSEHLYGIDIDDYITGAAADHLPVGFTSIEIYRTMNLRNPIDPYNSGRLFLERTITSDGQSTTDSAIGILPDEALVQQEAYDPYIDPIGTPPDSGACCVFGGVLISGRDADDNGGVGLVWTNPKATNMEEFSSNYKYDGFSEDGRVKKIINSSDAVYAFTDNAIYKGIKHGINMTFGRLVKGTSIASQHGVAVKGESVIMMTQRGVGVMDATGEIQIVSPLNRLMLDEWNADLTSVTIGYDANMGCVMVLNPINPTTEVGLAQIICLWEDSQRVSLLEGCPFVALTSGPDVEMVEKGEKVYMVAEDMYVVSPNHNRTYNANDDDDYIGTMTGRQAIDNGVVGADGINKETYGAGRYIYYLDGTLGGTWQYCDGSGTISAVNAGGVGTTFLVDPIAFRLRFPPFRGDSYLPLFNRKTITAISLKLARWSERMSTANTIVKVGIYKDGAGLNSESLKTSKNFTTGDTDPANMAKSIPCSGYTLEPYVEHVSGAVDMELTGIKVAGSLTISKENA